MAECFDCKRPYGDEHGFPDLVISNVAWKRISPDGDEGGLLCPSCICGRLHSAGMSNVEASFLSGPIKSVDSTLMHTSRMVENMWEKHLEYCERELLEYQTKQHP